MGNAPYYIGGEFGGFPEAPKPRGGMFGGGRNWGRVAADFLTNFSAGLGNPAAMAALQNRYQMQQQAGETKAREVARQQGLQDQYGLWQREQEYRLSHPEPTQLETLMQLGGIDPGSPEGRVLAAQAARNAANPMTAIDVQQPDGSVIRQWVRPGPGAPSTGPVVTDPTGWTPAGGAASGPQPFR